MDYKTETYIDNLRESSMLSSLMGSAAHLKQIRGAYSSLEGVDALGAAFYSMTGAKPTGADNVIEALSAAVGYRIDSVIFYHPVTRRLNSPANIIVSLNDQYSWTIMRIARWLDQRGF